MVLLRLPPALVKKLEVAAELGYRSRNSEAEMRLWETFQNESIDEHGVIVRRMPTPIK